MEEVSGCGGGTLHFESCVSRDGVGMIGSCSRFQRGQLAPAHPHGTQMPGTELGLLWVTPSVCMGLPGPRHQRYRVLPKPHWWSLDPKLEVMSVAMGDTGFPLSGWVDN